MKKELALIVVIFSILFVGCKQDNNIRAFVKTPCPISLLEGLEERGKFAFGYMKVPELFERPDRKTIDLAIAIFKPLCMILKPCQELSSKYNLPLLILT